MKHLLILLVVILASCAAAEEPNILIIVSDDQLHGTVDKAMPFTKAEIFNKGIKYENAYISNSTCCPSRASILTGLYSKNNKVLSNKIDLRIPGCGYYAKKIGYKVGIVGKYLNSHGLYRDGFTKANFDYWAVNNKRLRGNDNYNLNGEVGSMDEHVTEWNTKRALEFLDTTPDKFLLYVTYHAPHGQVPVDHSYDNIYKDFTFNPSPTYQKTATSKPNWIKQLKERKDHKRKYITQLKKLQVVDLSIERIINRLGEQGRLDNTYIFFISDNGIHTGQFKLSNKWTPYEQTIHVPMALRGPGIEPGVSKKLVGNIDIAPTIANILGFTMETDGKDLRTVRRRYYYLQGGYHKAQDRPLQVPYTGIMTKRFKLINTQGDVSEFYDLRADPNETTNLYYTNARPNKKVRMQRKLNAWKRK